jgi:hypothetical protein
MNSSIEVSEAVTLAEKLIQRTKDGRLAWDANCIENQGPLAPTHFTTVLEGNLRATVSCTTNGDLNFSLVEFNTTVTNPLSGVEDYSEKEVLRVSVEKDPAYGYDTPGEKQLASLLVDLHGLARRSALKVAGSVERALTYLDRIAS